MKKQKKSLSEGFSGISLLPPFGVATTKTKAYNVRYRTGTEIGKDHTGGRSKGQLKKEKKVIRAPAQESKRESKRETEPEGATKTSPQGQKGKSDRKRARKGEGEQGGAKGLDRGKGGAYNRRAKGVRRCKRACC